MKLQKNNAKTMVLAAGLRGVRRVRLVVFKHCDLRAAGRRR